MIRALRFAVPVPVLPSCPGRPRAGLRTAMPAAGLLAWAAALLAPCAGVEVTTQAYDNARTGATTSETQLTLATVAPGTFGKLFTLPLIANVNGQVLYLPHLRIAGGVHDTIFLSESDNQNETPCAIQAFDADQPGAPLWSRTLTPSAQYSTSTPVIDTATATMYVVTKDHNNEGTNWLHAIDIATGAERGHSPVAIAAQVPGTSRGSHDGTLSFPGTHANCRPGLLLVDKTLFLGFAFNSDAHPYHGWVVSYRFDGSDFTLVSTFCVTPEEDAPGTTKNYSKDGGGIWQAGKGLVSDGTAIYCSTGNGSFTVPAGGRNYSQCVLKLSATDLSVLDWFAPAQAVAFSDRDEDMGNTGPLIIPGTQVLFLGGTKYGAAHLVDSTALGHFAPDHDTCLQTITGPFTKNVGQNPVAWDGGADGTFLYVWSQGKPLAQFRYDAATRSIPGGRPVALGASSAGGSLCVSSHGTQDGILWAVGGDGVIHAYDARSGLREIWNSRMRSDRDRLGLPGHFQFPVVADGKLFVGSGDPRDHHLAVYGLLAGR